MLEEKLVKNLTGQELKELIRSALRDEIKFFNMKRMEVIGKPLEKVKELPKGFTITCEDIKWQ